MLMKNSNDNIGDRTRDLPTCSAVTQPTAPPRILIKLMANKKLCDKSRKLVILISLSTNHLMIEELMLRFRMPGALAPGILSMLS